MNKIILNILKKLESNGYSAYIVGGYVRDYLLGIESNDVDICTNALPKDVIGIFKLDRSAKDNYGSINIKTKKFNIDITTFRKESDYENHLPNNTLYINDIKEDLKRRDFTINALLMNSKSKIIDYNNGKEDLRNKLIRCIGDTNKKLGEDPLRVLRALRLSIIYNLNLDQEIVDFIKDNKKVIEDISFFRRKEELDKILSCKNKIIGLNTLKKYDLCDVLGININNIKNTNDIHGMYAQIEFDKNYSFTKSEKEIIDKIKQVLKNGKIDNKTLYNYGLYINVIAGEILGIDKVYVNKMYKSLPIKNKKDIKIKIDTLVKINNNCYNGINKIYSDLEDAIINNKVKNNTKDIIKYLEKK